MVAITCRAVFGAIPIETADPVFMGLVASGPNETIKQRSSAFDLNVVIFTKTLPSDRYP